MKSRIIELYNKGMKPADISKALGIHRPNVYRYIDKEPKHSVDVNEVVKLINEGVNQKETAKKLGISSATVNRICKELKIGKRQIRISEETKEDICKRYLNGEPIFQLVKSTGVHRLSIYQIFKSKNIELRPNKVATKPKTKKTRERLPAIKLKETINKGHIKEQVVPLPNREDKDLGIKVALLYSDVSDFPSKKIEVIFRCQADDVPKKAEEWAKKHNKKSFKIV